MRNSGKGGELDGCSSQVAGVTEGASYHGGGDGGGWGGGH